jgi:hypothetical protein
MKQDKSEGYPASRAEAIRLGFNKYWTGRPCKWGHVSLRLTSTCQCTECNRLHAAEIFYEGNPEGNPNTNGGTT